MRSWREGGEVKKLTACPPRGLALGRTVSNAPVRGDGRRGREPTDSIIALLEVIARAWRRHLWELRTAGRGCGGNVDEGEAEMSNKADIIRERRHGITFAELREGRCKSPLGTINDPPEWFCGETVPIGKVYCERCQAKAYNRQERRR
jgi:hypothetical protein